MSHKGNILYRQRINLLKNIQLILVIACVIAVAAYGYFITRPEIIFYELKDECGPIGGSISHPLDDEDACGNACLAYCLSRKMQIHDSKFVLRDPKCNMCTCYC